MGQMIFTFFLFVISCSSTMHSFECDLPDGYEYVDFEPDIGDEYVGLLCKSLTKEVPDSNNAMATLESGPSALVAGHVNVITGDFVDSYTSMTVSGVQPLIVQANYCSSEKKWNFRHMPSLEVGSTQNEKHLHASYLDDHGSGITYRAEFDRNGIKERHLIVPSRVFNKGLTNCGFGIINGKTNLRNSFISIIRKHDEKKTYMHTHASGIKRIFVRKESKKKGGVEKFRKEPVGKFQLESENFPNGNRLLYRYEDEKLTSVKAVNKANQELAKVSIKSDPNGKGAHWFSASGYSTFTFYDNKHERIHRIIPTHGIPTTYWYNKHSLPKKKTLPDGRFLQVKFHREGKAKGRVWQLINPLGVTHSFDYNLDGETYVKDAEGNLTTYCYDKKTKRLQSVRRSSLTGGLLAKDNFFWSDVGNTTGNLLARTFEDGGANLF